MSTQTAMERHDNFLGEVTQFIRTFPGWDVIPTGIEHQAQLKEQLKRDYTMASQYKRTEADLMVRCECLEVSFFLEAKAPHNHSFPTLAIELLPLHVHWQLSHITECVYVCEGETSRGPISVGFHAKDAPTLFDSFIIPELAHRNDGSVSRFTQGFITSGFKPATDSRRQYTYLINRMWPEKVGVTGCSLVIGETPVRFCGEVKGSGDPFATMSVKNMVKLKPWKEVLTEKIQQKNTEGHGRGGR